MVNAGRILIMPRGEWDALTSYNMLDLVTESGVAYLSKQTNVGQDPALDTSMTYWQPFGSAVVPDNDTIVFDANNKLAVNIDGYTLQYDSHNSYIKVNIDGVTLKYDAVNGYIYADVSSSLAGLTDVQLTNIQNGQIIAYNSASSKFVNVDLPVGGGSKIKVTTSQTELYGKNVTLSDGVTTLSGTLSGSGEYTFEGVELTGTLTISSTDGVNRATRTLSVQYYSSYEVSLAFFSATITVTFDASKGATCTLDGVTVSTSPYAFTVSSAGTYTASSTLDGVTKQGTAKVITTDGQTETDTIAFGTINLTYGNEFRGQTITCAQTGGSTITKTAPSAGNTMSFYPDATGTWEITGAYSGTTYSSGNITVSSLSTAVSTTLQTNVTLSVTMYGAAGATISWTDQNGAQTATLDNDGTKTGVSIVIQPSGQTITFTDTNKAKDPDDLSNNYTKNINLTANTSTVNVMPDGAIYWYGYKPNPLGSLSIQNTNYVTGTKSENLNDVTLAFAANSGADWTYFTCPFTNTNDYTNASALKTIMSVTHNGTYVSVGVGAYASSPTPHAATLAYAGTHRGATISDTLFTADVSSITGDKYTALTDGEYIYLTGNATATVVYSAVWLE
ncbi:MAG: hypothetical protein IKT30_06895 [Bacteroidaceae bacterium]|nr:hypothetical protein [Bacteroidaceae bacterium]